MQLSTVQMIFFFSPSLLGSTMGEVMCPFQNMIIFIQIRYLHRNNRIQNKIENRERKNPDKQNGN